MVTYTRGYKSLICQESTRQKEKEDTIMYPRAVLISATTILYLTWHYRLGHANERIVAQTLNDNKVSHVPLKLPYVCTCCQIRKSPKLPFTLL